jgi:hypothetical protein
MTAGMETGHTVPPKRADLVLSSDVPHGEGDVFVLDRFNVKSFGRIRGCYAFGNDYGLPMVGMVVTISPSFSL